MSTRLPNLALPARTARPGSVLQWLAGLLLAWVLGAAQAEGLQLSQLSTERADDGLALSFSTRFDLPKPVEDALSKGVPIYFSADVAVLRNRWYWRDARVARASRSWRLAWQPLTRQYRVSTGGLNQSYESLAEAVASLRGVSGWRIADAKDLEDDGRYYVEFSYKLDTSQLPRPMQIGLGAPQGWDLKVERTLQLNPDFSAKTAP